MRFVVTGAAGFIGSHLTDALLGQGHDVVAIDCFTDYYDPALKEDNAAAFDVARLDLAADELALDGFDGVFHLAGQPGVRSFGAVFEQLASAYAKSFRLEAVVLRYFTVYGPRQRPDMALARVVDALARGASFELYGDGLQSRSFTYVADVVAATIAGMERAPVGALYNVGGGVEATMRDAIATLERVSGRTLDVVEKPTAAGDVRRTAADTGRIERELGWRAQTALADGLQAQWEWASVRVAAP